MTKEENATAWGRETPELPKPQAKGKETAREETTKLLKFENKDGVAGVEQTVDESFPRVTEGDRESGRGGQWRSRWWIGDCRCARRDVARHERSSSVSPRRTRSARSEFVDVPVLHIHSGPRVLFSEMAEIESATSKVAWPRSCEGEMTEITSATASVAWPDRARVNMAAHITDDISRSAFRRTQGAVCRSHRFREMTRGDRPQAAPFPSGRRVDMLVQHAKRSSGCAFSNTHGGAG